TMLGNVRLLIDDEGMTISNPGGFIDGVNLKNLLTVEPHGRNPALADAMKRIGLAEKTGRGIDRIFEGSIIFGRPWPDYSESTSRTVKLFIQRAAADLAFAKIVADEQKRQGKPLSIYTLMILSVVSAERRSSIDRIVEATNLSENKVRSAVETMVELGLLEASGKGNNREYILGKKIYRENRKQAQYVRQSDIDSIRYPEMVLKLADAQNGIITKQDVIELLKVSPSQAYAVIKTLQQEGRLELECGGKYSKYRKID
ncbi:MAG: AAA family ATPase, partial [Parasporobacterium sp.]|nr:AAA family ATPase [Parasporobacterium sp.]